MRTLLVTVALVALAVSPMAVDTWRFYQDHYEGPVPAGSPERAPRVLPDLDPDPRVVHVELDASEIDWEVFPGHVVRGYGYAGSAPGPTIEANVGDELIVDFTNHLDEPTTIHWHGLRVPADMDGTPRAQDPIPAGGTFRYQFVLPDAGTFWYHPHANETVQMERGLVGAIVVRDPADPVVDAERVLVLDDLVLGRDGQIRRQGGWTELHDGREGDLRLVNGVAEPALAPIPAGTVERWRFVNAASARYVRLSLGGRPFRIVGTDGGLVSAPIEATEVLVAPADRVDLVVGPFAEGETVTVESLPFDRVGGRHGRETFATVVVGAPAPSVAEPLPDVLRGIEPLAAADTPPSRSVHLGARMSLHGVDFLVDGEREALAAPVPVGELQVWDVTNDTLMHHPFHLHGFFFQVLAVDGAPVLAPSWEDSVDVPGLATLRIAWMPDDRPGPWMFHCHILEHAVTGMMGDFEVVRR